MVPAPSSSTLGLGDQFVYELTSVIAGRIYARWDRRGSTRSMNSGQPNYPLPYWGWGAIPDQYGRRWADDEGEGDEPDNPGTGTCRLYGPGGVHSPRADEPRSTDLRGAADVPTDGEALAQHEFGENVVPLRQWPRLGGERVEADEGVVDRGLRCGAGTVDQCIQVAPPAVDGSASRWQVSTRRDAGRC